MQFIKSDSGKRRFRLDQKQRRLLRIAAVVVLCSGAGYMGWLTYRDSTRANREIAERMELQAAADRAAAAAAVKNDNPAEEARLRTDGSRSPAAAARYANWLITRQREKDAMAYLDQLPEALRTSSPVRDSRAELLALGGRRDDLRAALLSGDWGPIESGPLQLAFAAQIAAQTAHGELAADLWKTALQSAESSPMTQTVLRRLGQIWALQLNNKTFAPPAANPRTSS